MEYPYSVDVKKFVNGKETTVKQTKRRIEEREEIIKKLGIEKFRKMQSLDEKYSRLEYLELPKCYKWIWEQFYNMWSIAERDFNGNAVITPRTVMDYEEFFAVRFTIDERKLLFRIKSYVAGAITSAEGKNKDE